MQRRKALHIKQSELAETIGITGNQVSNIENGKSMPSFSCFMLLCNALNCNADYLLSGTISNYVDKNIVDMIASCTIEEQNVIIKLLDCYIHRSDIY